MSSPYSIEPPRWLQEIARPSDVSGALNTFAGIAGGLIDYSTNDKPLGESFRDALMRVQDPMWNMKKREMELGLANQIANLSSKNQTMELNAQNLKDGITAKNDITDYTLRWKQEGSGKPQWLLDNPITSDSPIASKWWNGMSDAVSLNENRDQQNKIRIENSKLATANAARKTDWNNALAGADQKTRSSVAALPNGGWLVDPTSGAFTEPSLEAVSMLNDYRKANGQSDFGASSAQIRANSIEKVIEKKIQSQTNLETMREQSRQDLQQIAQDNKISLEKYKSDLKIKSGGKAVGRDEFINRQYGRMIQEIDSSWSTKKNGAKTIEKISSMAQDVLGKTYDSFEQSEKSDPPDSVEDSSTNTNSFMRGGFTVKPK